MLVTRLIEAGPEVEVPETATLTPSSGEATVAVQLGVQVAVVGAVLTV